jgi:hypothetical protein
LAQLFISGEIWTHIVATFGAALLGLLIGSLIGMALAMLAAASRATFLLLEPFMTAMNAVPRIVLAPLLIIWFGIGIASKVALAVLLVAVLMFFAVFTAIAQVDRRLIDRVRTLGCGRRLVLTEVYIPSIAMASVQPQGGRRLRFHGRDRRRVRRLQPRPRLSPEFRAGELQCVTHTGACAADHGFRASAVGRRWADRAAAVAVAVKWSLTK